MGSAGAVGGLQASDALSRIFIAGGRGGTTAIFRGVAVENFATLALIAAMAFGTVVVEEARYATLSWVAATALAVEVGDAGGDLGVRRRRGRTLAPARHDQPHQ